MVEIIKRPDSEPGWMIRVRYRDAEYPHHIAVGFKSYDAARAFVIEQDLRVPVREKAGVTPEEVRYVAPSTQHAEPSPRVRKRKRPVAVPADPPSG